MFCKNCGIKIPDESVFCFNCGEPVGTPVQNSDEEKAETTEVASEISDKDEKDLAETAASEKNVPETPLPSDSPMNESTDAPQSDSPMSQFTDAPQSDSPMSQFTDTAAERPAPGVASQTTDAVGAKPKRGKINLIPCIAGGVMVLMIIVASILAFAASRNHGDTYVDSDDYAYEDYEEQEVPETIPKETTNTAGNSAGNIACGGIATIQGDTIYYMQVHSGNDDDIILSMDKNGGNEKELYTFAGDIYYLNVIGDTLYFNGDSFDESDTLVSSNIYCYRITDGTVETVYNSPAYLYGLFVKDDKMYFAVEKEDSSTCDIYASNLDGSNATYIASTSYYFTVNNDQIYYCNDITLYRCDMNGNNSTEIYTSSDSLMGFCLENSNIYVAEYVSDGYPAITAMNADGSNVTNVVKSTATNGITEINIDNGKLYYVDTTYNDDFSEAISASFCFVQSDGSGAMTLGTTDGSIYNTSLCGGWLFYYDSNKGETVKLKQ